MCSRRHGEVVLEVRRLQKTDISSYQQKGTGAPQLSSNRTARLQWCREHHNWTEQDWACVLFSDESRFSLSSDCRRQPIWRESGTAYRPENIQEKRPISDMQYHGVGRHHDQWPHAPTCGCRMGL
ncbi:hypothetical protein TNCV_4012261 [Trichonephila clavipes]|nr:hypothetical protein TNCV_4012261 [Trichonephila clavipes]